MRYGRQERCFEVELPVACCSRLAVGFEALYCDDSRKSLKDVVQHIEAFEKECKRPADSHSQLAFGKKD